MNLAPLFLIVLLLPVCARPAFAQTPDLIDADRPGLAESSTVVGKGRLQLETGLQWEPLDGVNSFFFPTLFRVGLSSHLEARIEGNTLEWIDAPGTRESGLTPVSFGVEAALMTAKDLKPGLGVIARVFPAWGSGGFASDGVTGDVRLTADWGFAPRLSLNPNVGVGWYEDDDFTYSTGLFALTLSYAPRPNVSLFIDAGGQTTEGPDGLSTATVDAGVAYIPGENWQVDISAGKRVFGETSAQGFVSIGFAYRHK
jgi:hypothetical protein